MCVCVFLARYSQTKNHFLETMAIYNNALIFIFYLNAKKTKRNETKQKLELEHRNERAENKTIDKTVNVSLTTPSD